MALELPRFVVFQSVVNNKYLCCITDEGESHGFLRFSGEEVLNPRAKFEIVMSCFNGLVRIRCCYNNKCWGITSSGNLTWITATNNESEGGFFKFSVSLFKPIVVNPDAKEFRFLSCNRALSMRTSNIPAWGRGCLCVENNSTGDLFTVIDWESLVIMPKYVAFKGDNGKYLSAATIQRHPYLEFTADDIGNPRVGNEITTTGDGNIRIKSIFFGKYWRRSPNWIWADTDDTTTNNPDTLFRPVKVGDNIIALRNLGNNNFCKRLTTEGKTSCLNAGVSTISREARIELSELVISREIYNLKFRLDEARIYGENIITMATASVVNKTNQLSNFKIPLEYTETETNTWNSNFSWKVSATVKIQARIPRIFKGNVSISSEFQGNYDWGRSIVKETKMSPVYEQSVNPMTKVTVTLVATQGTCDVPYSYTQRDTLMNGERVIYSLDDGLYTGVNSYNFNYESKEEDLRSASLMRREEERTENGGRSSNSYCLIS